MLVRDPVQVSERLLAASARHSLDPATEVDWTGGLVDGLAFMPAHRSSLYGTPLWDRLSPEQRIELGRHELASIASVGVWFELILAQMLVRRAYDRDPRTARVQYALTEIADECRHSTMFGRMIETLGVPAYGPGRLAHLLGKFFAHTSTSALTFAAALYVEELLDQLQREGARDPSMQPLVRQVCHVHVVEEARHMRYAEQELARAWERYPALARAFARLELAIVVTVATRRLIHPDVYAAVGLDPKEAVRVAAANRHWKATVGWAARKAVGTFSDLGMIGGPSRWLWRHLGLLDGAQA